MKKKILFRLVWWDLSCSLHRLNHHQVDHQLSVFLVVTTTTQTHTHVNIIDHKNYQICVGGDGEPNIIPTNIYRFDVYFEHDP